MQFDDQLLQHIAFSHNDAARSMLNENLAKASDDIGSLLHHAALWDNGGIIQPLIELGSDIEFLGYGGRTALIIAVEHGSALAVKVLLGAGANIKNALQMVFSSKYIGSAIVPAFFCRMKAEASTTEELVQRLLNTGCTLHHAALAKDVEIVKGLLLQGIHIDSRDCDGKTALHVAAAANDFQAVKLLVDLDADVNALHGPVASLFYAAHHRNVAMVRLLLEEGADPNSEDRYARYAPLYVLYAKGKTGIVEQLDRCTEILLQHGAVPQKWSFSANTILDWALYHKDSRSRGIDYLLAHLAMLEEIGAPIPGSIARYSDVSDRSKVPELEKYYKSCQQVLKIRISGTLSLLDLLTESEGKMRLHMRNETLVCKIESFCSDKQLSQLYPYYYNTLMRRILNGIGRVKLEDKAIPVICDVFKRNHNECYFAMREIVGYLSERDLKMLCQE